jgi:hypothetical protein
MLMTRPCACTGDAEGLTVKVADIASPSRRGQHGAGDNTNLGSGPYVASDQAWHAAPNHVA